MIQRIVVVFITIIFSVKFFSQSTLPVGAQSAGMGGVSVANESVYSAFNNQAGLVSLKKFAGVVNYENRYLLPEIGTKSFAAARSIKAGVFSVSINSFGNKLYSENKYGLAFAKGFGDILSVGIQMNYLSTRIAEGYGKSGVAAAELGIQSKPIKNLIIGAHVFNPTRAQLADYNNERLPTIFKIGAAYLVSTKVTTAVEFVKDIRYKPEFRIGLEYKPVNVLYIRVGVATQPSTFAVGIGLQLKDFRLDISSSYHPMLGYSPQMGLVYQVK